MSSISASPPPATRSPLQAAEQEQERLDAVARANQQWADQIASDEAADVQRYENALDEQDYERQQERHAEMNQEPWAPEID